MKFFSSLIDDLFFAFFRVNGSMEELVSLLRVYRRKKDLWDPKMPLQEGKRNENQLLRVWEEEKAVPDPKKSEKTGLES